MTGRLAFSYLALTALVAAPMIAVASPAGSAPKAPPAASTSKEKPVVIPMTAAQPFPLSKVRLLDGPFKTAMKRDGKYLLALEPDRFLHNFREFAGLAPKAPRYGGWESTGLAGHSLGHYLSACAMMYASTGDARYKARVDYIVSELALCQKQNADGYVAAIPDGARVWGEVARGEIRAQNFDLNGAWVPWYNLHKLFAGLIDAYRYCDSAPALAVATRLGDWAVHVTANLTDAQWQQMLVAEHGGMNEAMADLYALTGKPEYLKLACAFHHNAVLDPLNQGEDRLSGLHANTQIPKVIGVARQYELTGDTHQRDLARFFWERVTQDRSYVIGGNSDREHFFPPDQFDRHLGPETAESCNTYNMLKLTRHLFSWEPSAKLMDYYERALYNHILASQDPESGGMTYFVPLESGRFKVYNTPDNSFWCCTGSGMENHSKYGESIYFHDADSLYVNLFVASELAWSEKGITVRQETRFPDKDTARLTLTCAAPVRLTLRVRYPGWSHGMTVSVNGKPEPVTATPGSYVVLSREWRSGDTVDIHLPMALHLEALPHVPNTVALLYGPVVLAGELGKDGLPDPVVGDHRKHEGVPVGDTPVFVAEPKEVLQHVVPVAGKALTFRTKGMAAPQEVTLSPFYELHRQRYAVYWDVFTPAAWKDEKDRRAQAEAEREALQARTVDEVRPGEQQPEVDHHFQGESTGSGDFNGRKYRHATNGGWFSYEMKVTPADAGQVLRCDYWGGDTGARTFDILVDGTKIATQTLSSSKPGAFLSVEYPLAPDLTRGKQAVTIRFQAQPGNFAGGLFGCLILKGARPSPK